MEIEVIKKIIKSKMATHDKFVSNAKKSELYYHNENDILRFKNPTQEKLKTKDTDNPLRSADNRVSHPWHSLLVDQKTAYSMTIPPKFDTGDDKLNDEVAKLLGDDFPKTAKDLCVKASNAGVAWLHVWKDEEYQNFFRYAVVDSKQVIPIYSKKLTGQLEGVLRVYQDYDEKGDILTAYEYWNDKECSMFKKSEGKTIDELETYEIIPVFDSSTGETLGTTDTFTHDWGNAPFIPFRNNPEETPDLKKYKNLIDVYDKVYAGFVNDLDDIQEIIFVLTNYSGEDKRQFLNDLKEFKMVKVDDDGDGKGNVETLAIDIPIEARAKLLEMTHNSIFLQGQGVDPQKNIGQNNSGAALEYMYTLLELKTSMLETEFRQGFAKLVRFILRYSGANPDVRIEQKWRRTSIKDETTTANVISALATVTSQEAISRNNPLVEDPEKELEALKLEREEEFRAIDDFKSLEGDGSGEEE